MKDLAEIRHLLDSLNHWEKRYGIGFGKEADLKDTGEANARIAELKRKLAARGAVFHWNGAEYVLDDVAEPGRPEPDPDALENQ